MCVWQGTFHFLPPLNIKPPFDCLPSFTRRLSHFLSFKGPCRNSDGGREEGYTAGLVWEWGKVKVFLLFSCTTLHMGMNDEYGILSLHPCSSYLFFPHLFSQPHRFKAFLSPHTILLSCLWHLINSNDYILIIPIFWKSSKWNAKKITERPLIILSFYLETKIVK